jgi:hypothetical protein
MRQQTFHSPNFVTTATTLSCKVCKDCCFHNKNLNSPNHPQKGLSAMATNQNGSGCAFDAHSAHLAQLVADTTVLDATVTDVAVSEATVSEIEARIEAAHRVETQLAYEAQIRETQAAFAAHHEARQQMVTHTNTHWFWQCHIVSLIFLSHFPLRCRFTSPSKNRCSFT